MLLRLPTNVNNFDVYVDLDMLMHDCAVIFVNFGLQSLYDLYDGETLSDKPPAEIRSNAEGGPVLEDFNEFNCLLD